MAQRSPKRRMRDGTLREGGSRVTRVVYLYLDNTAQ